MNPTKSIILGAALVAVIVIAAVWARHRTSQSPEAYSTASPTLTATVTATASASASPVSNDRKNNMHEVTIITNLGTIVFQTYDADAPKTVDNFITLANKKFYDGTIFHRVIKGFMIQGGDPTGTGKGGPGYQFADELNATTDSYKTGYVKGVVAMANAGPDTNGSQFFVMHEDYPLDHNYTIFGHVVRGQDIVDKIASVPVNNTAENRPVSPVTIQKVTVKNL